MLRHLAIEFCARKLYSFNKSGFPDTIKCRERTDKEIFPFRTGMNPGKTWRPSFNGVATTWIEVYPDKIGNRGPG
jgi:hypothetical protein